MVVEDVEDVVVVIDIVDEAVVDVVGIAHKLFCFENCLPKLSLMCPSD